MHQYIYKNQFWSKQPSNTGNTRGLFIYLFREGLLLQPNLSVSAKDQSKCGGFKSSVEKLKPFKLYLFNSGGEQGKKPNSVIIY